MSKLILLSILATTNVKEMCVAAILFCKMRPKIFPGKRKENHILKGVYSQGLVLCQSSLRMIVKQHTIFYNISETVCCMKLILGTLIGRCRCATSWQGLNLTLILHSDLDSEILSRLCLGNHKM